MEIFVEFVWRGGDSVGLRITVNDFYKVELGIVQYPALGLLYTIPEEYGGYMEQYQEAISKKTREELL